MERQAAIEPETTRLFTTGGLVLTLVAMTVALLVMTLLVYGAQYVTIGIYISPASKVALQSAVSRGIALPIALYLGARLASAGPEHRVQAMMAAVGIELFGLLALSWWDGAHALVAPIVLLGCAIGVFAAREGASAGAPPYANS